MLFPGFPIVNIHQGSHASWKVQEKSLDFLVGKRVGALVHWVQYCSSNGGSCSSISSSSSSM